MAVDKVKPFKMEEATSGTEVDTTYKETDPTEDYLAAAGMAYGNQDDIRSFRGDGVDGTTADLMFEDQGNSAVSLTTVLDEHITCVDDIQSAETFTIPIRRQMIVHEEQVVSGVLNVIGELIILD